MSVQNVANASRAHQIITKMNTPRTIKALATVDGSRLQLKAMMIYDKRDEKDLRVYDSEKLCEVEIKFVKWLKKKK